MNFSCRSRPGWVRPLVTGTFLFFSPNIIWLTIALTIYFLAPYDIQAAKTLDNMDWIFNRFWRRRWTCVHFLLRFWINFVVTFGYYGFWRCTLDIFGWSSRPFNPQRLIGLAKVHQTEHTFYVGTLYFLLGTSGASQHVLLLSGSDSVHSLGGDLSSLLRHWSSSLPQQPTSGFKLFQHRHLRSLVLLCSALSWCSLLLFSQVIPTVVCLKSRWYRKRCAHSDTCSARFIHIRALYKHIHAVHHRNTDIEPFAGLSMHPIEVLNILKHATKIGLSQCWF